jgi:hypothetical protein
MPEIGRSGSMSGDGKRDGVENVNTRAHPRLYLRSLASDRTLCPALTSAWESTAALYVFPAA